MFTLLFCRYIPMEKIGLSIEKKTTWIPFTITLSEINYFWWKWIFWFWRSPKCESLQSDWVTKRHWTKFTKDFRSVELKKKAQKLGITTLLLIYTEIHFVYFCSPKVKAKLFGGQKTIINIIICNWKDSHHINVKDPIRRKCKLSMRLR